LRNLLNDQDPVLLLAIAPDAGKRLITGASKILGAPDLKIADKSYPAISFAKGKLDYLVLIDPATHFVRQFQIDQRRLMGRDDVKAALVTIDYAKTTTGPSLGDSLYT